MSAILPWVSVIFLGPMNLFRLTTAANSAVILPWATVGVGVALAIAALAGAPITGLAITSGIAVVVALIAGGADLVSLVRAVHDSDGFACLGVGFYSGIAALALLAVGAVRVQRMRAGFSPGPSRWHQPPSRLTWPVPPDPRPGWKPDPWGLPGRQRYWDGSSWWPESR